MYSRAYFTSAFSFSNAACFSARFSSLSRLMMFSFRRMEAILRMIKMVVDNAHKEGIWAGICGELGADTTLTEEFVKMGVDELSVTPTFVLPVRKIVREME